MLTTERLTWSRTSNFTEKCAPCWLKFGYTKTRPLGQDGSKTLPSVRHLRCSEMEQLFGTNSLLNLTRPRLLESVRDFPSQLSILPCHCSQNMSRTNLRVLRNTNRIQLDKLGHLLCDFQVLDECPAANHITDCETCRTVDHSPELRQIAGTRKQTSKQLLTHPILVPACPVLFETVNSMRS